MPLTPKSESSLLANIFCDMALTFYAQLIGSGLTQTRQNRGPSLKFGIEIEFPVSTRTVYLKGGIASP